MLLNVKLENYLTVGNLSLDFDSGFIAITGESGAGKSILSAAIAATLGNKISSDSISFGKDSASVTTVFDISGNIAVKSIVEESEYGDEEDDDLIIRVVVDKNNRKKYFINGCITKQRNIKELSEHLVDYFGQNHQLRLTDESFQVDMIDRYASKLLIDDGVNHLELVNRVSELYSEIQRNKKVIFDSKNNTGDSIGAMSLLEYQFNELSGFDLSIDYIDGLKSKLSKMEEAKVVDEGINKVFYLLGGNGDSDIGISSTLSDVLSTMRGIDSKGLILGDDFKKISDKVVGLILESADLINDAKKTCGLYLSDSDGFSQIEYDDVSREYKELMDLSGKHNVPVDSLCNHLKMIEDKLVELRKNTKTQDEISEIISENEKLISEYIDIALIVSENRVKAAVEFESKANLKLVKLGFINDKSLIVSVDKNDLNSDLRSENQFSQNGIDKVLFMIQPNIGQEAKPLSNVASGGELSRVSLVLESIVSESSDTKVMFFDEIESGVSSNIAKNMAFLLKEISSRGQVFAITHAPHIAASASQHIFVSKSNSKSGGELKTKTNIKSLNNDNAIIQEISRMLVGDSKIINSEVYNVVKSMRRGEDVDIDLKIDD